MTEEGKEAPCPVRAGWRGPDGASEQFHSHRGRLAGCQLAEVILVNGLL